MLHSKPFSENLDNKMNFFIEVSVSLYLYV